MKRLMIVVSLVLFSFSFSLQVFATRSCEDIKAMGQKYYIRCKEAPLLFNFDCLDCNFQTFDDGVAKAFGPCEKLKGISDRYYRRCIEAPELFDFECLECNFQEGTTSVCDECTMVPGRFIVCPDGYYHFQGSTVPTEISDVMRNIRKDNSAPTKRKQKSSSQAAQQ